MDESDDVTKNAGEPEVPGDAQESGDAEEPDEEAGLKLAEEGAEEGGEGEGGNPEEDADAKDAQKLTPSQQKAFDKRVGKEVARRKTAEEKASSMEGELRELRERASREDDQAVLYAAEQAGVMPEIVTKGESRAIGALSKARRQADTFEAMLDDEEKTEFDIGGTVYTRAQVKGFFREWKNQRERLERENGGLEADVRKRAADIWKLGMAAKKAGWNPAKREAEPKAAPKAGAAQRPEPKKMRMRPGDSAERPLDDAAGSVSEGDSLESAADKLFRKKKE